MENTELKNYARFLAKGFDTIQESYNAKINEEWAEQLFFKKTEAQNSNTEIGRSIKIGDFDFIMRPQGQQGYMYHLENPEIQLLIKSPAGKIQKWQISVRYLSAGLWLTGYDSIKKDVLKILDTISIPTNDYDEEYESLGRADFAFDFYSPEFRKSMTSKIYDSIVAVSGVKKSITGNQWSKTYVNVWGASSRVETLYIGTKSSLQVTVYDKTREIAESSGEKVWLYEIWGKEYKHHVYRVEVRMAKDWLVEYRIKNMEDLKNVLEELIETALMNRRITIPSKDTNRSRWELNPLWKLVLQENNADYVVPRLGKISTLEVEKRCDMYEDGGIGYMRNWCIAKYGEVTDEGIWEYHQMIINKHLLDPQQKEKIKDIKERHKFIGQPK